MDDEQTHKFKKVTQNVVEKYLKCYKSLAVKMEQNFSYFT